MGENTDGQLGDGAFILPNGPYSGTNKPEQIASNVVIAAAGVSDPDSHSLFIKSDGSLWGMGQNDQGQLGDGTFNSTNKPEQIISSGVVAAAAGNKYSLFLKSDGSLWGMGDNSYGQLGDGTFNSTNRPKQIVSSNVTAIACGAFHNLFLKSDGSLWDMGLNLHGQLGDGTYNNTNRPERIVSGGVTAIACGEFHNLFLKSDGSLWSMGFNEAGQLGDGTYIANTNRPEQIVPNGVVAIAAGSSHSLFIKSDGSLWGMGSTILRQLGYGPGDGHFNATNRPVQIISNDVIRVVCGNDHSLFLKSDGSMWGMGADYYGEIGDSFTNQEPRLPEQIFPSPQPILTNGVASKTNLQFNAACGFGGTFYLLTSTNLGKPLNQWTSVWTNTIYDRSNNVFAATLTNAAKANGAQQFYILQSQ